MFEPHYKLKITTPNPKLNDAIWEVVHNDEWRPNCVWGKFANGEYRFSYCQADKYGLKINDKWDSKPKLTWVLACCNREDVFRELAPTDWSHTDLLKIPADKILTLRSDSPGMGNDVILIEKQFLDPITPNFRTNKFGIPIKPCRKEIRRGNILDPTSNVVYGWCEIHHQSIPNGRNNCDQQVPNQYMPCDVEDDQAGPYCHTHGGYVKDYNTYCNSYAGPLIDSQDSWRSKEIPESYETCDYWRGQICGKHEGTKLEGRDYCEKYDGPLLFIDPT